MQAVTRAGAARGMSSHDPNTGFAVPWHIPRIAYGSYKHTNVFVSKNSGSHFVALNRPEQLNALDLGMIRDLTKAYDTVEKDELCHLVLLYGAGEKAFCAGGAHSFPMPPLCTLCQASTDLDGTGDVAMLAKQSPVPMGQPAPQMEFFKEEYKLIHKIGTMKDSHQVPFSSPPSPTLPTS